MTFDDQNTAALESLGYTSDEARFLYLVAVHSGYFAPRQFLTFTGTQSSNRPLAFAAKLESRGHATWREYHRIGRVYHLFSKTLNRFINKENLPTPRRHSVEFIRTRLLLLDFILANSGFAYFETELEKTAYFCDALGIPKEMLPARSYEHAVGNEPTLRYFVDRFPMYLDHTVPGAPPVITFSYVDAGVARVTGFANHLKAYLPLFRRLQHFSFIYVAAAAIHFRPAEKCFATLVRASIQGDLPSDIPRYFRLRNAWELKQYSSLSTSDVEWLKEASGRFEGERFEDSYRAWASGALSDEALRTAFEQLRVQGNLSFQTYLVPVTHLGKKRLAEDRESAPQASTSSDA
jgi:hypothetical protein